MKEIPRIFKSKLWVPAIAFMFFAFMAVIVVAEITQEEKQPIRVKGGRANVKAIYHFSDDNDTQLKAAQAFGIQPLKTRNELDSDIIDNLSKVETSNLLVVEPLTHSVPYLTKNSSNLLNNIASNFQRKLMDKGITQYQIVVTSLLRTEDDVRRLQKVNSNAVNKSCHLYGTTFDIAYYAFQQVDTLADFEGNTASHAVLVNLLGQTLKELRDDNKCYIKYERRQPCFHITSRY